MRETTRRRRFALPVVAALLALVAAACGGNGNGPGGTTNDAAFDPNDCQGGTLQVLNQRDITHLDPARLYTSGGGNIPSLLFRTLTTRNREGGAEGTKVVPDLATDTGKPSADAKTWTYHAAGQPEVRRRHADHVQGRQVRHRALVRAGAARRRAVPARLAGDAASYQGPYKDPAGIKAIETPDDKTIVFKLRKPEGDFPYLATATQFAPVPKAKDTGTRYENQPVSSGPYKVESYEKNKLLVLARNEHWSRDVDPQRLACPDRIEITSGLDAAVINQRLATSARRRRERRDHRHRARTGRAGSRRLRPEPAQAGREGRVPVTDYIAFNTKVKPFDDSRVREAISYAINRQSVINAVGGSRSPTRRRRSCRRRSRWGYQHYDYFPAGPNGDPAKAKAAPRRRPATRTGSPSRSRTEHRRHQTAPSVAAAVQDALKQAGITVKLNAGGRRVQRDRRGAGEVAGSLAVRLGCGLAVRRPVPAADLRRPADPRGGGNYNLAQLNDPKVNEEFDAINKLTDLSAAAPRYGALDATDRQAGVDGAAVPRQGPVAVRQEREERVRQRLDRQVRRHRHVGEVSETVQAPETPAEAAPEVGFGPPPVRRQPRRGRRDRRRGAARARRARRAPAHRTGRAGRDDVPPRADRLRARRRAGRPVGRDQRRALARSGADDGTRPVRASRVRRAGVTRRRDGGDRSAGTHRHRRRADLWARRAVPGRGQRPVHRPDPRVSLAGVRDRAARDRAELLPATGVARARPRRARAGAGSRASSAGRR